jgi:hypothetical protein
MTIQGTKTQQRAKRTANQYQQDHLDMTRKVSQRENAKALECSPQQLQALLVSQSMPTLDAETLEPDLEELLAEDHDLLTDEEDDSLEPTDAQDESNPDALVQPQCTPVSLATLDLTNVYWLVIYQGETGFRCRFQCQEWLQPSSSPYEPAKKSIVDFMTKLAEWLELKAQPFLAQPSAAMFSHSQGQKYQHYCSNPIITQKGLVASIGLDDSASSNISRLLKGQKVWLVWRNGPCLPVSNLFSKIFRQAWAHAALNTWCVEQEQSSVDWQNTEKVNNKEVSKMAPNNDLLPEQALRRIASAGGLGLADLANFMSENPS